MIDDAKKVVREQDARQARWGKPVLYVLAASLGLAAIYFISAMIATQ